jgi:hypothetical protein
MKTKGWFCFCVVRNLAPSDRDNLTGLREDLEFFTYVLNVAHQKVHQIQDKGSCDGPEGKEKSKLIKYICQLGRWVISENR